MTNVDGVSVGRVRPTLLGWVDGKQVIFVDPDTFTKIDLAHESRHVGQIERWLKENPDASFFEAINNKVRASHWEIGAYTYEKRIANYKEFAEDYSLFVDEMIGEYRNRGWMNAIRHQSAEIRGVWR